MPGIIKRSDLDSYGWTNISYSTSVKCENIEVIRYGDSRVHPPEPMDGCNCGITIKGAEVMVENLHLQYIGHPTTSGSVQCQGTGTVIAN